MIGAFPKAGFFMSTLGIEDYRAAGNQSSAVSLLDRAPAFVLANSPALEYALTQHPTEVPESYLLFAEDAEVLRANFVHHWGPIWVAGKAFNLAQGSEPHPFEVLIDGRYTVEADTGVLIDDAAYRPGDPVMLSEGWQHPDRGADAGGNPALGSKPPPSAARCTRCSAISGILATPNGSAPRHHSRHPSLWRYRRRYDELDQL